MNLNGLRKELDVVDAELIAILAKRFAITQQVGTYKKTHNLPARDAEREQAKLQQVAAVAQETSLNPELMQKIMQLIMDEAVENHDKVRSEK